MKILRWLSILLLPFAAGCGVQDYQALVRGRMQELNAANVVEPIEWSEFRSNIGVIVDIPMNVEPTTSQQGNASAQELAMTADGKEFRVVFMSAPTVEAVRLADTSQQQFRDQGFVLTDRRTSSLRQYTYDLAAMENPHTSAQAFVRAFQIAPDKGCVLTVSGKRLANSEHVTRFLESVRPAE